MDKKILKLIVWVAFFCLLWAGVAVAGTAQYTYDNLGRLVQVVYDNGPTIVYTYDAAGNRIVQQVTTP